MVVIKNINLAGFNFFSLSLTTKFIYLSSFFLKNFKGSHGLEIQFANSKHEHVCEQALVYKAKIPDLVEDLRENVCISGGWIEQKVFNKEIINVKN